MAYFASQPLKLTMSAGADLSAKQFYFVKISAANTVVVCSAATDKPIGVLQNAPVSGASAEIVVVGVTKINADAALSAGNLIGTSGDGQADAKTPGTDTTEYTVGQMLTATGAAGVIGTAVINCAAPSRAS